MSCIMSNYNDALYIGEALEAIVAQSFRPTEVIVIDDGSTDNSVEVIGLFAERYPIIRFFRNERNKGVDFSYKRGLNLSSCDYIYLASANDKVLPGFFEKAMNLLGQYPQAGLCYTDLKTFDGCEYRFHLSDGSYYFPPDKLAGRLKTLGFFGATSANSVVKRTVFVEAGGIISELRWSHDSFAMLVIGLRHGVCYIPEPLMAFRTMPNSYSGTGRRQWSSKREILNHLLPLLHSPAYSDVSALIKRTRIWPILHPRMLPILMSKREHWGYLSPTLIRRAMWQGAKDLVGPVTPLPMKRIYFRIRNIYRRLI